MIIANSNFVFVSNSFDHTACLTLKPAAKSNSSSVSAVELCLCFVFLTLNLSNLANDMQIAMGFSFKQHTKLTNTNIKKVNLMKISVG